MRYRRFGGLSLLFLSAIVFRLPAQYALQVSPKDTTICSGNSAQLNVSGGSSYTWSPSSSLNSSTSASPVATPSQSTNYVVSSQITTGNLAINGNFNLGDTGFTSAYISTPPPNNNGQQRYWVGTTPSQWSSALLNCPAYTGGGGDGNMMMINGAETFDVPIWCETIRVYPNSTYTLSGYTTALDNQNLPKLQWMVNGTPIGSGTTPQIVCLWQQFSATWNSGSTDTLVTFCAFDQDTFAVGNDFALADMSITAIINLSDTVTVNVLGTPQITISHDTTICSGETATLNASAANSTYLWSTGATTSSISVNAAGTYTVRVNNGCFTAMDSAVITLAGPPTPFDLGNDTIYCGNFNRVLSTGNANTMWSTGYYAAQITVNAAGTYWATEQNQCGLASDTIVISTAAAPVVSIGPDTAICSAQTVILDAGNPGATYSWSNNSHYDTISLNLHGTYSVTVTNSNGCSASGSVVVSNYIVPLSINSVNTSCGLANGRAAAIITNGHGPFQYFWSDSVTAASIFNLPGGAYIVTVTDVNGCTGTDTANIVSSGANSVTVVPADTLLCPGDSAMFCATSGFVFYNWSNGSTSACMTTTIAGSYSVTVTDIGNCTASSQNSSLEFRQPPSVTVSINGDTLTCYSASTYQWYFNDTLIPGATSEVYIATETGNYKVVISDSHGCSATSLSEKITVSGIAPIFPNDLRIYPNPLESGNWILQVGDLYLGANIEVFDDNGRRVYRGIISSATSTLDFNAESGIYFMRIIAGDKYYSTKLVKL